MQLWSLILLRSRALPPTSPPQALAELFKPILHTLLLIWQHSQHWNTPPRLVAVMREVCNDLIRQARKFIPGGVGRPQRVAAQAGCAWWLSCLMSDACSAPAPG